MLCRRCGVQALVVSTLLLCFLTNNAFAQDRREIHTRPIVVFENQGFEIEFTPHQECVERYGNAASSKMEGDVITISYEIFEYDKTCAIASPALPGPWPLGHFLVPVEGLLEGTYTVSLSGIFNGTVVAGSMDKTVRVFSTDNFLGAGQLHFNHETPISNEVVSGIGVIRGWACRDEPVLIGQISFQIDGNPRAVIPHGSSRGDTQEVCGGHINNGYGAIINWNRFGDGNHTFALFIDGEEKLSRDFVVSGTGENFLKDLEAEYQLNDFPSPGDMTTVRWSEAAQNFIIVDVSS